jgi:hypothetical protein
MKAIIENGYVIISHNRRGFMRDGSPAVVRSEVSMTIEHVRELKALLNGIVTI